MPFGKFIFIPIFIAFQAFAMMVIGPYLKLPGNYFGGGGLVTWIAFQAWAMYFFAGFAPWNDKGNGPCPRMAFKTLLGYLGGILCSISIFELGFKVFGSLNKEGGTPWGLNLAVFLVVIAVICFERVPWFGFIPAWFVGAGVFFAVMSHVAPPEGMGALSFERYIQIGITELFACIVGMAFGWGTVTFRVWYEAKVAAPAAAEAPDAEASNAA